MINLWIGQGDIIYTAEETTMEALNRFLYAHCGCELVFDSDFCFGPDWKDFERETETKTQPSVT
jgi:hypothetical protein